MQYHRYFVTFSGFSAVKNENVSFAAVFEVDEPILSGLQIDSLGEFMGHQTKMKCTVSNIVPLGMSEPAVEGEGVIRLIRKKNEQE